MYRDIKTFFIVLAVSLAIMAFPAIKNGDVSLIEWFGYSLIVLVAGYTVLFIITFISDTTGE